MRVQALTAWLAIGAAGLLIAGCSGSTYSTPPPAAPTITAQPVSQTVTAGNTASFSVTATGAAPLSYQWQKGGTAISGATSSSYTTPPTTTADNGSQFTVVVSNSAGSVTSSPATLTVNPASTVSITTASLPNGTPQTAYSATLQATGGTTPYTWSVVSGQLPAGLSLGAASGTISGTPTTAGTSSFNIQVGDSAGNKASAGFTITISPANSTVTITTTSLPNGTVGAAYVATLQATGGTTPYTWSVTSGQLPAGLTLAASGSMTGTPTTAGNSTFTIQVVDNAGSKASAGFTITINAASGTVTITTTSLPNGTVGAAYSATLQATGGTTPYTWSVTSGQLPAGLTLAASGSITGTPTTAGNSTFTIQVVDNAGSKASANFTITIGTSGTMPQFAHVFIVLGENSSYSQTYNSSSMPYLTSLANQYGLATKYWADTHPSIGNYEALASGQIFTNDDGQTPSSLPLSADNIAFEVQQAGKTWKDYVESGNGCGALNSGNYIVRHDPLQYFTNINTQTANFVCFSQFATDLANHTLPNLSWLSPNGCDDAHDCPLSTFDNWLKTEIGPLLASSYFQPGGDGLLIITFDEDDGSGTPNCSSLTVGQGCGGQVETVLISPRSKMAYQSTAGDPANFNGTYDEANILRTIAEALGVKTSGLGGAATRVPMADFF
jgi:hypothetical protein